MNKPVLDWKKYSHLARKAAAEGCVLLENAHNALPIRPGETVAVFGRIQLDYYKSGTGSGGMVNVPYVHSILDGLCQHPSVHIYEPLLEKYRSWSKDHPFDCGSGWGTEPWCQEEMPLADATVAEAAAHADLALVILGRTAGEDRDNTPQEGSYYLTTTEKDMLQKICTAFSRTAVVLNVGNILDMSWIKKYKPQAVLYVWQGGMEGGAGAADVLCGDISPCGKLPDTIARSLEDYPSIRNFGSSTQNLYEEDIYVGYRYFETFAREQVLYPFGFGLSYTQFSVSATMELAGRCQTETAASADCASRTHPSDLAETRPDAAGTLSADSSAGIRPDAADALSADSSAETRPDAAVISPADIQKAAICVRVLVRNTGDRSGKEVVQIYVAPPQGLLGKPARNLAAFGKTRTLQPDETQELEFCIPLSSLASYDDSGITGHRSCFVLEAGDYRIYTGTDVRSAGFTGSFMISETTVVRQCQEALAPVTPFQRFRPQTGTTDTTGKSSVFESAAFTAASAHQNLDTPNYAVSMETVPLRTADPAQRCLNEQFPSPACTGDQGYRLADVQTGTVSMEQFLAQLSDRDLTDLVKGEGMCSPRVTPGTAAAFGGVTDSLQHFGIPAGCCADGPSGIRMDCGTSAFSLPNGTLLASTFNPQLVAELFHMEGLELYSNQIDALLGPGINIHRSPLNGRNFEYHSEDPYLTGKMAEAQLMGLHRGGVSGTMKHFCANNQEHCRHSADSVISERALREIYLKPFEMGVRTGCVRAIMTSYGPVNGIWTAGNYDLNTALLRKEWGYRGLVMTDWWAMANTEGQKPNRQNLAAMVRAQNDVYMVTPDAASYKDNLQTSLDRGQLTRGQLLRSAANICAFLLTSPAMQRLTGTYTPVEHINRPEALTLAEDMQLTSHTVQDDTVISLKDFRTDGGSAFILALTFDQEGYYDFILTASCSGSRLAQMSVTLSLDSTVLTTCSLHGSEAAPVTFTQEKDVRGTTHYLKFYFSQSGLTLYSLRIRRLNKTLPLT